MPSATMIPLHEFCLHYKVEQSFIFSLKDAGLIEVSWIKEILHIPIEQLPYLEKLIRLYEMDINLEGIETITHLLERINKQEEIILQLTNRLRRFEEDELKEY